MMIEFLFFGTDDDWIFFGQRNKKKKERKEKERIRQVYEHDRRGYNGIVVPCGPRGVELKKGTILIIEEWPKYFAAGDS